MTIHRFNEKDFTFIKPEPKEQQKEPPKKKISKELQKEINCLKEERAKRKELTDKRNLKIKKICRIIQLRLEGNSNESVAETMGVCKNTITNYMRRYNEDHKFMLKIPKYNTSELEKYEFLIEDLFLEEHIKNYSEAQRKVEEKIINSLKKQGLKGETLEKEKEKIKISHTQFKNFLERHDFKKNYRGYLYHYQTTNVKARWKEKINNNSQNKQIDVNELEHLKKKLTDIENYAKSFSSNYKEDKVIDEIIKHFELYQYKRNDIKKFLMNNSEYF